MAGIAVLITSFDLGRTLEGAVESALAQTRPPDELLVVDDGSGDAFTRQVLCRLERRGVRVLRLPHEGVAAARNAGVRATSAPYLVFLDADDELAPTWIARAAERLDLDPGLDVVSCGLATLGADAEAWTPPPFEFEPQLVRPPVHISTMMRRRVWEAVGGFDGAFRAHEDWGFWVAAAALGMRGAVIDEPLVRIRVRRRSRTALGLRPEILLDARRRMRERHRDLVTERTEGILIETAAFLGEQLAHREHLRRRRETLAAECGATGEAALAAGRRLLELGVEPIEWGDLAATAPIGRPSGREGIEAHYVRVFLEEHVDLVRGRVLEIAGTGDVGTPFGPRFGVRSELVPVACLRDLAARDALARERYECVILAHALGHDPDPRATLRHALGLLAPGGALLCTVSAGASTAAAGDAWGATEPALRGLLAEQLPGDAFELRVFGNALVCVAAAHDLAAEDLSERERAALDPAFPLVVCARARKPWEPGAPATRDAEHGVPRGGGAGVVLAYHRTAQVHPDFFGLCVPTALFRAQMEHVAERWRVLPLAALLEAAEAGDLPERSVALSFDDGTLDALEVAAPILEELGLPATFFAMAEAIDGPAEFWETELAHLLLEGGPRAVRLDFEWAGASRSLPFGTPAERYDACWRLLGEGYSLDGAARQALLETLARRLGRERPARPSHRRMGSAEIREIARRPGCAVGAHGVHHLALPRHAVAVQHAEIAGSRVRLEALLGRPVTLFAYPYGEQRADAAWLVEAAGFRGAVTVEPGAVRRGVDPFRIPRHGAPALARERFGEWLEARFRLNPKAQRASPAPRGRLARSR